MSEPNTLTLTVDSGVSYLPIPTGAGQNFAGLLTLELPVGIRTGQEFEVLVRRVSTKFARSPPRLRRRRLKRPGGEARRTRKATRDRRRCGSGPGESDAGRS